MVSCIVNLYMCKFQFLLQCERIGIILIKFPFPLPVPFKLCLNRPLRPLRHPVKVNFFVMFVIFSLIFFACSLIFSLSPGLSLSVNGPLVIVKRNYVSNYLLTVSRIGKNQAISIQMSKLLTSVYCDRNCKRNSVPIMTDTWPFHETLLVPPSGSGVRSQM